MTSSVKSDDLVSRVLNVNDVDLKEIEGHESEKANKTLIAWVAFQTIELKRFYGKIWKKSEGGCFYRNMNAWTGITGCTCLYKLTLRRTSKVTPPPWCKEGGEGVDGNPPLVFFAVFWYFGEFLPLIENLWIRCALQKEVYIMGLQRCRGPETSSKVAAVFVSSITSKGDIQKRLLFFVIPMTLSCHNCHKQDQAKKVPETSD